MFLQSPLFGRAISWKNKNNWNHTKMLLWRSRTYLDRKRMKNWPWTPQSMILIVKIKFHGDFSFFPHFSHKIGWFLPLLAHPIVRGHFPDVPVHLRYRFDTWFTNFQHNLYPPVDQPCFYWFCSCFFNLPCLAGPYIAKTKIIEFTQKCYFGAPGPI